MHELSVARSVVQAVEQAIPPGRRVAIVGMTVGTLSGTIPEALEGAWPIATTGTALAGSTLTVTLVQAAVWCHRCAADRDVDEFYAWVCPVCATPCGQLARGRECAVAYADLVDVHESDSRPTSGVPSESI